MKENMKHKLEVGQKLWVVWSSKHRSPCSVEVEKVGRKWAEIPNGYRINLETLYIDGRGYTSPGRCYLSKKQYEQEKAVDEAWWDLCRMLRGWWGDAPDGVTVEAIAKARELLGLKNETKSN